MSGQLLTTDLLCTFLSHVLDPNPMIRKGSEEQLSLAKKTPHYGMLLLQAIASDAYPQHIRQSAAVLLKNFVQERNWCCPSRQEEFPLTTREGIKSKIISTLVGAPELSRRQLLLTVRYIYMYEEDAHRSQNSEDDAKETSGLDGTKASLHPSDGWPQLYPQLIALLRTNEPSVMVCALRVIRELSKRIELCMAAEDVTSRMIPDEVMSILLQLVEYVLGLAQEESPSLVVAQMLKVILKVLWSSTMHRVPATLYTNLDESRRWIISLQRILRLPILPSVRADPQSDAWGCVKWSLNIIRRWFQLTAYGDTLSEEEKRFTSLFKNFLDDYTRLVLDIIHARADRERCVPVKPFVIALEIIGLALGRRSVYKMLVEHIPTMITEHLFPELKFTLEDEELWQNNPQEYVRRQLDPVAVYNVRANTMYLIESLVTPVKSFHQTDLLPPFLLFLSQKLQGPIDENAAERYAALYCIRSLHALIRKLRGSEAQTLHTLAQYVLPCTQCLIPYLRSVACEVLAQYTKLMLSQNEALFTESLTRTSFLAFNDSELPVAAAALVGLQKYLKKKASLETIEPHLGTLVKLCFRLMREVGDDEIIATLDFLIDRFGDQLSTWATQLCETLVHHFWDVHQRWTVETTNTMEDDMGDGGYERFNAMESLSLAAESTLCTIRTLIASLAHHPEITSELQPVVLKMLIQLLQPETSDTYLDTVLQIFTALTFCSRPIHPMSWEMLPLMHRIAFEGAMDYLTDMLDPIDNLIASDTATFVQSNAYIQLVYELCKEALKPDRDLHENDMMVSPKLMETMIQHCRSYHDAIMSHIPAFYDLILSVMRQKDSFSHFFQLLLYHVIINGFWFDAHMTWSYLNQKKVDTLFFTSYIEFITSVRKQMRSYDRKVSAIGLSCVLPLLDPELIVRLQPIIWEHISMNHQDYLEEDKNMDEEAWEDSEEFSDEDSDNEGYVSDEDEDDEEEDENDLHNHGDHGLSGSHEGTSSRKKKSHKIRFHCGNRMDDEEEIDDEEFPEDDYCTVLDDISEAIVLRDVLCQNGRPLPEGLEEMCAFAQMRLQKRKEFEQRLKERAKATQENFRIKANNSL